MKKDRQAKMIASSITNAINEQQSKDTLATIIANEVTSAMEDHAANSGSNSSTATPSAAPTADQINYYLGRAAEEVNNAIRDTDFALGEILVGENPEITNIVTGDDGTTKVSAVKSFKVDDVRDVPKVIDAMSKIAVRPEFAKYIAVSMQKNPDSVIMNLTITLPKAFVDSIDGGDFKKRAALVDKAISKILDAKLGD